MAILKEKYKGRYRYRYQTYYKDNTGKRRRKSSKWYETKREAERALREFLKEPVPAGCEILFKDAWEDWQRNRDVRENSKKPAKSAYSHFCPLHNKTLQAITQQDLENLFKTPEMKKFRHSTRKNYMTALKTFFKHAEKVYSLNPNPARYLTPPKKNEEELLMKDKKVYTVEEFNTFLNCCGNRNYRNLFFIMYWTGMRIGEALGLRFCDVDKKAIHVRQQAVGNTKKAGPLKTATSRRDIAIDSDIWEAIEEQRAYWSAFPKFNEDWSVFTGPEWGTNIAVNDYKKKIIKENGLEHFTIHSLRHAHASNLILSGIPIIKVSKRLGHANIGITMEVYAHLLEDNQDDILTAIYKK